MNIFLTNINVFAPLQKTLYKNISNCTKPFLLTLARLTCKSDRMKKWIWQRGLLIDHQNITLCNKPSTSPPPPPRRRAPWRGSVRCWRPRTRCMAGSCRWCPGARWCGPQTARYTGFILEANIWNISYDGTSIHILYCSKNSNIRWNIVKLLHAQPYWSKRMFQNVAKKLKYVSKCRESIKVCSKM